MTTVGEIMDGHAWAPVGQRIGQAEPAAVTDPGFIKMAGAVNAVYTTFRCRHCGDRIECRGVPPTVECPERVVRRVMES